MALEIVSGKSSELEYLHRDFHGALSVCLDYILEKFGEGAAVDYLKKFALSFYAPLREEIRKRGLSALKEHFEKIYAVEGGKIEISFSEDELILRVEECPAVKHMKSAGFRVSKLFRETDRTVYGALCEGTRFAAEMQEYDESTGKSIHRFYRESPGKNR